ncbi:glycoside hydrolase family 88 protein [Ceratobasidium sp. AG-Ba]|nr:glycoside hydrolase family 88 protein [Ceratobasidium sp. AG-Ba]QRW02061.1 glycoside hydrolase family 88 protein [Ceratobasidium sp. AG-Ba]
MAELDYPEYSVYGFDDKMKPYSYPCLVAARRGEPKSVMQFGLSVAVRQSPDGRLSQEINDGLDGASLDGASSGLAVLIGMLFKSSHSDYLLLYDVPRSRIGAISHRSTTKSYWADAVYVGFPFIAAYGAVYRNESLLLEAYNNCRLCRDALQNKTTGLWAHIYNDDAGTFDDAGQWATGNAWAAKGMLNVATMIEKGKLGNITAQVQDLKLWVGEVLNGTFSRLDKDNLVPNHMERTGNGTFGDAAASSMLAATAFRAATQWPTQFT